MPKLLKVYCVGSSWDACWIPDVEIVQTIAESDLVIFPGGADINPAIYGEPEHPRTYCYPETDKRHVEAMQEAVKLKKFMVGICRGAQLMCAMQPKGKLIQHQSNPGSHKIKTYDGKVLKINSLHHQAQYPFDMPKKSYKILAWTEKLLSFHQDGNQREMNPPVEVEVVYYPRVKGLAIQGHPEMLPYHAEANNWHRMLLDKMLHDKL